MTPWPHQEQAYAEVLNAIRAGHRRILVTCPTGGGKCLGLGTQVLMHNGNIVRVEDVRIGDRLMGPDSQARIVTSTTSGRSELYRVSGTDGTSYVVNSDHILSVKLSPTVSGQKHAVINLCVADYLSRSRTFRHRAKGWRAAVDFPQRPVPLDPYILGLWLADGDSQWPCIYKPDLEVRESVMRFAESRHLRVAARDEGTTGVGYYVAGNEWRNNSFLDDLRTLKVIKNKHVPKLYLANDRPTRLGMLAGLLDGDGSLHHCGTGYEYSSVEPRLSWAVSYLARSLGLSAKTTKRTTKCQTGATCESYRVHIFGDCSVIPCRIKRKKASVRIQKKDHTVYGIRVDPLGEGAYYGFELEGPDGLFLLGDFTVTHNTRIMLMLAKHYDRIGRKVTIYTNRKLLVTQTSGVFGELEHGIRSAGHEENKHLRVQVSSIQTEDARVNRKKTWQLHEADLVLADEAHLLKADVAKGILDRHRAAGAAIVGFTATPLDLEEMYDHLIVAGRPSELRACGALVSATHYGADEPDLAALKRAKKKMPADGEDFSENQARAAMCNPTLFGRVWEWYGKLNPDHKPTILFAPGTQESLWFAEQFTRKGVASAHVASGQVWMDGVWLPTTNPEEEQESRQAVLAASKSGKCKVICNRFLLREGIDAPWLEHGIFATIFGGLQTYLQSGGRLLRASPSTGKTGCVIQDHGGNWWRHGSLNADRHWDLQYTSGMAFGLRAERLRENKEREPWRCQGCGEIRMGAVCKCGYRKGPKASRPVVTMEGELKEMVGDIFKPRRISTAKDGPKKWSEMYFRSLRGKGVKTFRQAMALFAYENHWFYPDSNWPLMPLYPEDQYRLVPEVPRERLR